MRPTRRTGCLNNRLCQLAPGSAALSALASPRAGRRRWRRRENWPSTRPVVKLRREKVESRKVCSRGPECCLINALAQWTRGAKGTGTSRIKTVIHVRTRRLSCSRPYPPGTGCAQNTVFRSVFVRVKSRLRRRDRPVDGSRRPRDSALHAGNSELPPRKITLYSGVRLP